MKLKYPPQEYAKLAADRWEEGMLATPPVPCPKCQRKTQAKWRCQHCRVEWNSEQLRIRDKERRAVLAK